MDSIATKHLDFSIRHATPDDAVLLLQFMRKLGAYQQMADEVTATEDSLRTLITTNRGEAFFGLLHGHPVGMLFFSPTCSAFTGRSGLFIDAFILDDTVRHTGFGRTMMDYLSTLALQRGGQMLEWGCLDWNAPAITFYQKLGAYCLDIMRIYRLSPDNTRTSAERF